MNCPKCKISMKPLDQVECRTGKALKHRCIKCGAFHFEQLTGHTLTPPPLKETFRHLAALAAFNDHASSLP